MFLEVKYWHIEMDIKTPLFMLVNQNFHLYLLIIQENFLHYGKQLFLIDNKLRRLDINYKPISSLFLYDKPKVIKLSFLLILIHFSSLQISLAFYINIMNVNKIFIILIQINIKIVSRLY